MILFKQNSEEKNNIQENGPPEEPSFVGCTTNGHNYPALPAIHTNANKFETSLNAQFIHWTYFLHKE